MENTDWMYLSVRHAAQDMIRITDGYFEGNGHTATKVAGRKTMVSVAIISM
jgi:hypothetical protein